MESVLRASKERSVWAQVLEESGPPMWGRLMSELRETHLGVRAGKRRAGPSSAPYVLRSARKDFSAKLRPGVR